MHPAMLPIDDLLKQCEFARSRTRGPGGQHRNKVETGVTITHIPTGLSAQAFESRQQEANRKRALRRLRVRLAIRHRDFVPIPGYQPSDRLRPRLAGSRIAVNSKHEDYPAILAEVLDLLFELKGDLRKASEYLEVTSSQIVKFIRNEPEALESVNALRRDRGKPALK